MNINLANIDFCPGGKSATLTETTAEILLSETEKVIAPPTGTDGFNKVTITHAPVEESVSATITENGTHTITPSEGFGAMFGVNVDVNIPSVTDDKIQYFYRKPTADDAGLKAIGWTDDDVNYYKYNNYIYPWEADNYKVSDANKQIVINSVSDIATYKDNPDFQYCPMFDTSAVKLMHRLFKQCKYLKAVPQLDTSSVTHMGVSTDGMFCYCTSLTSVPLFDTSNVTNFDAMFDGCSSLTSIPQFNTSKATSMYRFFEYCSSLTSIPHLDTSNVTNMEDMFYGCSSLTDIPQLDTTKVTYMSGMFNGCKNLRTIPQFNTPNLKTVGSMFYECNSLETVPLFNTSNVTSFDSMFCYCRSLTSIPQFDTSKVTSMYNMFRSCTSLTSVPKLDATSLAGGTSIFDSWYSYDKFTTFGGFTNLKVNLDLSPCTALTKESLLNVFNEAADVTASPKKMTLGSTNLAKLTDADKAIATNKGWTLA